MGVDCLQACAQSLLWDPQFHFHQPNIEDTGALAKDGTSRWMEPGPMWEHIADSLKCVLDLKAGKEMKTQKIKTVDVEDHKQAWN